MPTDDEIIFADRMGLSADGRTSGRLPGDLRPTGAEHQRVGRGTAGQPQRGRRRAEGVGEPGRHPPHPVGRRADGPRPARPLLSSVAGVDITEYQELRDLAYEGLDVLKDASPLRRAGLLARSITGTTRMSRLTSTASPTSRPATQESRTPRSPSGRYADELRGTGPTARAGDHGTGWLAAFGTLVALRRRADEGGSWHVKVSLARTAEWPHDLGRDDTPARETDVTPFLDETYSDFGPLTHIRVPGARTRLAGPHRPGRDPATWW